MQSISGIPMQPKPIAPTPTPELLRECQRLLVEVSQQKYGNSLLCKVRMMLLACIAYKKNRTAIRDPHAHLKEAA